MTGKEEERRQAQQANEDIRDQAQRGAQEIQKSIEQAGEMIAVLNERMQDLEHMKENRPERCTKRRKALTPETKRPFKKLFPIWLQVRHGSKNTGEEM